jgi:hypothetical protein
MLQTGHGLTVVSLFEEFIRRRQLHVALSGLNELSVQPLLNFLIKYINHSNYSRTLIRVTNTFLGKVFCLVLFFHFSELSHCVVVVFVFTNSKGKLCLISLVL